jgi:hypothetical protein
MREEKEEEKFAGKEFSGYLHTYPPPYFDRRDLYHGTGLSWNIYKIIIIIFVKDYPLLLSGVESLQVA